MNTMVLRRGLRTRTRHVALVLAAALSLALLGAPAAQAEVQLGRVVGVGQAITSDDGRYSLRLQSDGNVVLSGRGGRVVWHSHTYGTPGGRLAFQPDGNLVAYARDGRVLWHTDTWGQGVESLLVSNDGRLVLAGVGQNTVWSSGTDTGSARRDRIGSFEDLTAGQSLVSPSGAFRLDLQPDGNAVVYGPGNQVQWHSSTFGVPGSRLRLQIDGNLVVYTPDRRPAWYAGTSGSYTSLVMQDDGNLVLYSSGGGALWSSAHGRTT